MNQDNKTLLILFIIVGLFLWARSNNQNKTQTTSSTSAARFVSKASTGGKRSKKSSSSRIIQPTVKAKTLANKNPAEAKPLSKGAVQEVCENGKGDWAKVGCIDDNAVWIWNTENPGVSPQKYGATPGVPYRFRKIFQIPTTYDAPVDISININVDDEGDVYMDGKKISKVNGGWGPDGQPKGKDSVCDALFWYGLEPGSMHYFDVVATNAPCKDCPSGYNPAGILASCHVVDRYQNSKGAKVKSNDNSAIAILKDDAPVWVTDKSWTWEPEPSMMSRFLWRKK
jgi:hypothetical protein